MQKTLDLSIKMREAGTTDGGYSVDGGKRYAAYMSNSEWDDFLLDMKQNHEQAFGEYENGSGGELKPKGNFPPKMASYGSSSRMIYKLSKEIKGFCFERKLPTTVGGISNMDGYLETDNTHIFVEAKCREPYGAKPQLIESKYMNLYDYIDRDASCNMSIRTQAREKKLLAAFFVGERVISHFDIKQMICHLLGVGTMLLDTESSKKVSFLYLVYNPRLIEIVDKKKEKQIFCAYDEMRDECSAIDFHALFESVLRFLRDKKKMNGLSDSDIAVIVSRFDFFLCDQNNYLEKLK